MRLIHFILLLYCFGNIRTKNESGRSLTFVIDRSYSLQLLIKQFKEASLNLTSKLMGRKSSDIVNVTLIVFDDPTYKLVVDTTDISEFEKNLKSLETYYDIKNKDCPEMSLSALKMALTRSLPRSYILLFTDATAKDVWLLDEVKILSKEKQSKVFFILTGTCEDATKAERKIYSDIATETSGAVLHIHNNNTLETINSFDFLKNEINSIITETTHDPDKTYEVQADEGVGDITVLASGEALEFKVNCANPLCKVNYDRFSNTTNIAKVNNPKGKVNVSLKGKGDVFISAYYYATFNFTYGFSIDTPARIEDTRTKREIFKLNYLAINVTGNEHNCRINEALVTDLNDTQLIYLTLKLKMVSDYFYVTEKAGFPRNSFKLVITGVDIKTGQSVRSVAIIEGAPHKSRAVVNENESVFIPRSLATRNANYGIEWNYMSKLPERKRYYKIPFAHKETETGLILPNVSLGHNGEYECIERSHSKGNSENFYVTKQKTILEVTKAPTAIGERYSNLKVQYGNRIEMMCAIKGHPQPRMRWYNSNNVLLSPTSQKYPDFVYRSILTVESVKKSEKYLCRASNKVGQISVEVNVTVLGDRPKFRQSVIITAVMEGTDAVIRCKIAEGKPKPTIKWIVNSKSPNTNKELSSHIGEELILRNITLSQAGHYICVAENTFGRAQQDTDLIVQAPPKILRREHVPKGIVGDVALSVPCTVSGYPVPTVVWKTNDTVTLQSGSKYNITKGNTLIINNLEHADAYTKYTCVAKNTFGEVNQTFDDIIYERPKFRKPAITTSVMEGRDAVIPCKIAEGKPKPTIKWIVNSKSPNTNKELSSHIGEELILRNIKLSQAGHYICVAENTFGRAQQDTDLIVQAPPKILRREDVPKGIVGDVALSVPCTVSGYPVPTVVWKANDTVTLHSGSKYNITKGNTLIINNLEHADAYTNYTCVAKNTFGEVNQTFSHIISEGLVHFGEFREIHSLENETVKISCPTPNAGGYTIRWFEDKKQMKTNESYLKLEKLKEESVEYYTCRVSDRNGSNSTTFEVNVGKKPRFLAYHSPLVKWQGQNSLDCKVSTSPSTNTIQWFHNGNLIVNVTTNDTAPLAWRVFDWGQYVCQIKNIHGTLTRSFNVTSDECLIKENLRRTVSNEPLLLSDTLEWPKVTKTNNFLNIKTETYTVACPNDGTSTNSFLHIPGESQVEATCAYEDKFWVKGKLFKYTDLNCLRDYQLGVIETKQRCHEGAELVKIGYNMNDFFNLFDVCFDYNNKRPVYSHVMMSEFLAQDEKRIDPCEGCYAMGKLVNPTDVVGSGLIQESYTYSTIINAVLIWQPPPETDKNKKRISFQDLEKEVHLLTRMFENIEVWTGTYKYIEIDGQTVPKYLWKVVGIPENDDMKVAYVYVNHPNESDADIWCDGTSAEECNELLNFKLDKYAYCCDIQTFYKETRFSF